MKLLMLTVVIAVDDEDEQPSPVPKPHDNPYDSLLRSLLLEASRGRTTNTSEDTPHGSFFSL